MVIDPGFLCRHGAPKLHCYSFATYYMLILLCNEHEIWYLRRYFVHGLLNMVIKNSTSG